MPVKLQSKIVHTNPPLTVGEVYKIIDSDKSSQVGRVFTFTHDSSVPLGERKGGTLVYLAPRQGFDKQRVLSNYTTRYAIITLQEV